MPINFCHIYPTSLLDTQAITQKTHLVLAHLVEDDLNYREFYASLPDDHEIILDNSGFEMFKQGREMYPSDKLIEMGNLINADCVVLSDYPGQHVDVTIKAAEKLIPDFVDAGFGTFFVPQSEVGESDQLFAGFEYALENTDIDLIGVSILGCPNAYGVERNNKLQRFLARKHVFDQLYSKGMLDGRSINRFHCLGMTDGPNEISLLKEYHDYISSWDSSAAPWACINGVSFDTSPTGLIDGKYEKEVDFNWTGTFDEELMQHNVNWINTQC